VGIEMRRAIMAVFLAAGGIALPDPSAIAADWTVNNQTTLQMFRLFVSPCGSDLWGPNLLAAGILEPGKSHVVRDLAGTCHEAKLVDEDGDVCVVAVRGEALAVTKPFLIKCQGHDGVYVPQ
jgi:hypothetical protein